MWQNIHYYYKLGLNIFYFIWSLVNAQKLATIIVRLSPPDSITDITEDEKIELKKTNQHYENEKLHSEPLINEKEKNQLR